MIFEKLARLKLNFFIFSLVFLGVFCYLQTTQAATSTLRGKAWWGDTYGYVYFNCLDDVIGELLDAEGNFTDGFEFYSSPCSSLVHAVEINSDNNFLGSAWNLEKGLINFSGTDTPPDDGYGFNINCQDTCNASNSCWACYNEITNQVYGWAQVASSGEWLRLDSTATIPVKIQSATSDIFPGQDIAPGDFIGAAASSLGDLDFNCKSEGSGLCGTRDYQVYIGNIQATNLSAPNWSGNNACTLNDALKAVLRWDLKSGQQTAFEIVVDTESIPFMVETSTALYWSGKQTSTARQFSLSDVQGLTYGTNYYWWLRLYDQDGEPSEWYQYSNNTIADTDGNPDSDAETFTTYLHEFPEPAFSWLPAGDVVIGTSTLFNGLTSTYYSTSLPDTSVFCDVSNCSFSWSTNDLNAVISSSTEALTNINFFAATSTTVSLSVSDADGYTCALEQILNSNYDLPVWREIKAE